LTVIALLLVETQRGVQL